MKYHAVSQQLELPLTNADATPSAKAQLLPEPEPPVTYRLIRTRRKTLALSVDDEGVKVRAPLRAPGDWIENFVRQHQRWINKQIAEHARQSANRISIVDDASIMLRGDLLQVKVEPSPAIAPAGQAKRRLRTSVQQTADRLVIRLAASNCNQCNSCCSRHVEHLATLAFCRWLKRSATAPMTQMTRSLAKTVGVEAQLRNIGFRQTKSKWGHCTAEGDIQYNPVLMLAPPFVLHYLVVHEVCHLRHRNHSKSFWRLVEKHCGRWREAEQWLKCEGYTLALPAAGKSFASCI